MSKKDRIKALELATKLIVDTGGRMQGPEDVKTLWGWTVYYENYIVHGADETKRRFKQIWREPKRPKATVLKLKVDNGKRPGT